MISMPKLRKPLAKSIKTALSETLMSARLTLIIGEVQRGSLFGFFDSFNDFFDKSGKIVGFAGSDEISINDHLLIYISGSGGNHVILDGKKAGSFMTFQNSSRNKQP